MRSVFRSFAKLAEQRANDDRFFVGCELPRTPLPTGSSLCMAGRASNSFSSWAPALAVRGRRVPANGSTGATEATPIASFQFNETGNVSQSSVPELVNENISQANGAWSIVGAVVWNAMR